jgi:3-methyladenine DNA glycosylase AlkD
MEMPKDSKVVVRAPKQAAPEKPTAAAFLDRLKANASDVERKKYERYFPLAGRRRGDEFIGVRMGTVFELARAFLEMLPTEIETLMESDIHEARAGAMSVMAKQYQAKATTPERRQELFDLYLRRHDRINDWDLVDLAAYYVIGPHLVGQPHDLLYTLVKSKDPWERRTAILATFSFLRRGDASDTLKLAELLFGDEVELVQKAAGWALRSVPEEKLKPFLDRNAARMPRAMLRNAIEKLSPGERKHYLGLKE